MSGVSSGLLPPAESSWSLQVTAACLLLNLTGRGELRRRREVATAHSGEISRFGSFENITNLANSSK